MTGCLYIVSTPIGNLDDMTTRGRKVLADVAVIAAEDTRHSGKLLQALGVDTPMVSYHDHNEEQRTASLLERLRAGEDLALISDAGTPLVSDPGYRLVHACRQAGIRVSPVPGASALLAALAVAGLPTDQFFFQGFLPAKGADRRKALVELARRNCTSVLYESPRRVLGLLEFLETLVEPGRRLVFCRELTKQFETVLAGSVSDVRRQVVEDANQQRGELVLVLEGAPPPQAGEEELRALAGPLLRELPASRAARVLAAVTGGKRQEIYRWLESFQAEE